MEDSSSLWSVYFLFGQAISSFQTLLKSCLTVASILWSFWGEESYSMSTFTELIYSRHCAKCWTQMNKTRFLHQGFPGVISWNQSGWAGHLTSVIPSLLAIGLGLFFHYFTYFCIIISHRQYKIQKAKGLYNENKALHTPVSWPQSFFPGRQPLLHISCRDLMVKNSTNTRVGSISTGTSDK